MDVILLEPGNPELVFGKTPDGGKAGIDAIWRDAAALQGKLYIARHSGDKTANIITIALRDALITEIQLQSQSDDMPTEQFKLSFTEILWTYSLQQADG